MWAPWGLADAFEQDPEFLLGIPLVAGPGLSRGTADSAPGTGYGEVLSAWLQRDCVGNQEVSSLESWGLLQVPRGRDPSGFTSLTSCNSDLIFFCSHQLG